jgi:hypothetical protein
MREYDYDREDLHNFIDDWRCHRARSLTPPRHSLARDVIPSGRGGFHALAPSLRQVVWPEKFKARHIDKYDGSNNSEEFIQVYHTIIKAAGGIDRVKANYLPTTLSDMTRSWLINLPERSIYTWDQLCATFIGNFQGTYKHPSTAETLKTIRQKHDESLRDYVKHFYNARNAIPYIQDIEIINAFRDRVSDIKIMEEIAMKKPKMVADLLAVTDTCIEASEARAWLLESHGKGPSKKKQDDWKVNMTGQGDHKDHGDNGYHDKQSFDQNEKRPFHHPNDTEKWCGIESAFWPPSEFWCLNDKTIKELMTFAKCEIGKMSYKLHWDHSLFKTYVMAMMITYLCMPYDKKNSSNEKEEIELIIYVSCQLTP